MAGHGDVWANVVLEKELRMLHLDPQAARSNCAPHSLSIGDPISLPSQSRASPNKATPLPRRPLLLTVPLPLGTIFFQTTTVGIKSACGLSTPSHINQEAQFRRFEGNVSWSLVWGLVSASSHVRLGSILSPFLRHTLGQDS